MVVDAEEGATVADTGEDTGEVRMGTLRIVPVAGESPIALQNPHVLIMSQGTWSRLLILFDGPIMHILALLCTFYL